MCVFFEDVFKNVLVLNKIFLVKWDCSYVYVSLIYLLVLCGLNKVYEEWGGEKISGILFYIKFFDMFMEKVKEEVECN